MSNMKKYVMLMSFFLLMGFGNACAEDSVDVFVEIPVESSSVAQPVTEVDSLPAVDLLNDVADSKEDTISSDSVSNNEISSEANVSSVIEENTLDKDETSISDFVNSDYFETYYIEDTYYLNDVKTELERANNRSIGNVRRSNDQSSSQSRLGSVRQSTVKIPKVGMALIDNIVEYSVYGLLVICLGLFLLNSKNIKYWFKLAHRY